MLATQNQLLIPYGSWYSCKCFAIVQPSVCKVQCIIPLCTIIYKIMYSLHRIFPDICFLVCICSLVLTALTPHPQSQSRILQRLLRAVECEQHTIWRWRNFFFCWFLCRPEAVLPEELHSAEAVPSSLRLSSEDAWPHLGGSALRGSSISWELEDLICVTAVFCLVLIPPNLKQD